MDVGLDTRMHRLGLIVTLALMLAVTMTFTVAGAIRIPVLIHQRASAQAAQVAAVQARDEARSTLVTTQAEFEWVRAALLRKQGARGDELARLRTANGRLTSENESLNAQLLDLTFTDGTAADAWRSLLGILAAQGITAICEDTWYSHAVHTQGQCSWHGGIGVLVQSYDTGGD